MSAEAVAARVSEIQAQIAALRGQGPVTGGATPPSTSFASALQSATGPTATAATASATAGGDSTPTTISSRRPPSATGSTPRC